MRINKFFTSIEAATKENGYLKYIVIFESISLILAFFILGGTKVVVVQQPAGLAKSITVSEHAGDTAFNEQWGLFFATLMGNVSPSNASFVKERMSAYFDPNLFQKMKVDIEEQIITLKDSQATLTFSPKRLIYEPDTKTIYINGDKELRAYGVPPKHSNWTMEFGLHVVNFMPVIVRFESYSGTPKTKEVKEREAQREERSKQ